MGLLSDSFTLNLLFFRAMAPLLGSFLTSFCSSEHGDAFSVIIHKYANIRIFSCLLVRFKPNFFPLCLQLLRPLLPDAFDTLFPLLVFTLAEKPLDTIPPLLPVPGTLVSFSPPFQLFNFAHSRLLNETLDSAFCAFSPLIGPDMMPPLFDHVGGFSLSPMKALTVSLGRLLGPSFSLPELYLKQHFLPCVFFLFSCDGDQCNLVPSRLLSRAFNILKSLGHPPGYRGCFEQSHFPQVAASESLSLP